MGSANAGPEYGRAEGKYLAAADFEERIYWLGEMIKLAPKHKSSEKMVAELKTRLIKLREKAEKNKKVGKSTQKGIKKDGPQAVLVGFTNSGKSALLNALTNASPEVANYEFTTKHALIGTMDFESVKIQMIDLPAPNHEGFDKSVANTADLLLVVISDFEDLSNLESFIERSVGKRLVVVSKIDLLSPAQRRKLEAKLRTNKVDFIMVSIKTKENLQLLKKSIFEKFGIVRIFTKEPYKEASKDPVIMKPGVSVREVSEKIYKGMSRDIKEIRIWGPSSKFGGQIVGLKHILKDKDIVEFKTR